MSALGSALQEEMAIALARAGSIRFLEFHREYNFAGVDSSGKVRKWRLDFYFPRYRLGVEVDGGAFKGRHAGGKYLRDSHERQNAVCVAGIRLLRFDKTMIRDGTAIETIRRAISHGSANAGYSLTGAAKLCARAGCKSVRVGAFMCEQHGKA